MRASIKVAAVGFWLVVGSALTVVVGTACDRPSGRAPRVGVIETGPLAIDQLYGSMAGPGDRVPIELPDLDWITALKTEVVEAESSEPMGEEFFCHAQIQLPDTYRPMVTATGISEIRFPEGFGLPLKQVVEEGRVRSDADPISFRPTLYGMVLNNHEPDLDVQVRVRATVEYLTDEDVGDPPRLKRLYSNVLTMSVEDLAEYAPHDANTDVTTHCVLVDGRNQHWIVPPGIQKTRRRLKNELGIDTRVHYAIAHLHNHGVYMRLTDITTGEIIWQADVAYEQGRRQIHAISDYSSVEGFPLYADHEYEIEALYSNTADHDVDAMAMMYLFHRPDSML